MKVILVVFVLSLSLSLTAQVKPDFFPEEISSGISDLRCYCKPGVRNKSRSKGLEFSYRNLGNGTFNPEDEADFKAPFTQYNRWTQVELDLKFPVVNKERLKVLIGYKYRTESYNINKIGPDFSETFQSLGKNTLKNNSISLILTHPIDETKYIAVRLRYTTNGNYSGLIEFDDRFAIYKGTFLYGIKPNEDFEWGVGAGFAQSFRSTSILPIFIYNRNFNARWGIESALPRYIFGRYNLNKKNIALFGVEYNSDSYRLLGRAPNNDQMDYAFNHTEIMGLILLERQIASWIWGNVKLGYQFNFSSDFESKSVSSIPFQVEPSDGPFFQIGVFISLPDDFGHNQGN